MNKNIEKIMNEIKTKGGCNIDADGVTFKNFTKGYLVSLANYEKIVSLQADEIANAIDEKIKQLKDLRATNRRAVLVIGAWYNNDDGRVYMDISTNIKERNHAIETGIKNNQYTIWDVQNACEIPLTKAVYILYRFNQLKNDFNYVYEFLGLNDLSKKIGLSTRQLERAIYKDIDAINTATLKHNQLVIIKDNAFIRDLQ